MTLGSTGTLNGVVVTGIGATTPLGGDAESTWQGLLAGRSAVRTLEFDWVETFGLPVKIGATAAVDPKDVVSRIEGRRLDRVEQFALIAAREAWGDAGTPEVDPLRLGVVVGTGIGGALSLLGQDDILETQGLLKVSVMTVPMLMPNGPAAWVGLEFGAQAGVHAPVSACASGSEALAWAWRMIAYGDADVVVAGGAEGCIAAVNIAGFSQMRAMSTRNDDPQTASRPFDSNRDGFVLGEGSGMVVLEREDFAAARGARVYAKLLGMGMSSDAYHISASPADGSGQARAMEQALSRAGLTGADISHVNAHATSTPIGDLAESASINRAIGSHPAVTAPKGGMGHLLGAAGAVESVITVKSIYHQVIPPTINLETIDPGVSLDIVTGSPRELSIEAAVNNSFGFGGHNVALAFGRA